MLSFHGLNIFICRANAFCSSIVCKEVGITKCSLNVGRNSYNSDFSLIYAGLGTIKICLNARTHFLVVDCHRLSWIPQSGFKDWRANWGMKQQKFPFTIVELFRFSKSHIVRIPPPGNPESRGQRHISCCRMSTVATYAAAGAGLVFVGLYLVR